MMAMKKYDTALIGFTYFSVGYAYTHENCIIIDKGINAGTEFFGVCEKYGDYFSAECILSQKALDCKCDILLETEVYDIDGEKIYVIGKDKISEISAKYVIDTTALKYDNSYNGRFTRLFGLACEKEFTTFIADESDYIAEYKNAVKKCENIASVYDKFIYQFTDDVFTRYNNYLHIPSAQFENGDLAFKSGTRLDILSVADKNESCRTQDTVKLECDVIVCGCGTAGSIAAIKSAECGYDVVAVDMVNYPCGTASAACVFDYYYGGSCEIAEKINALANGDKRFCNTLVYDGERSVNGCAKAYYTLEKFDKLGIRFLGGARIYSAKCKNGLIEKVYAIKGGVKYEISCRAAVDSCGILAEKCCEDFIYGRKLDGKYMRAGKTCAIIREGKLRGEWSDVGYLENDEFARSKQIVMSATKPPFENSVGKIRQIGSIIGEREVKRVKTKTVLNCENVFESSDDVAFIGLAPFDNTNKDIENENTFLQNWIKVCGLHNYGISYAFPKECMLAKKTDNLIICGKIMGMTHDACCLVRLKGDMELSGLAAGKIADELLDKREVPNKIKFDGAKLYSLIRKNGELPEIILPKTDNILSVLSSDYPESAYFSVLTNFSKYRDTLYNGLKSENETLCERIAISLYMMGEKSEKSQLEKIISGGRKVISRRKIDYYYPWLGYDDLCDYDIADFLLKCRG